MRSNKIGEKGLPSKNTVFSMRLSIPISKRVRIGVEAYVRKCKEYVSRWCESLCVLLGALVVWFRPYLTFI